MGMYDRDWWKDREGTAKKRNNPVNPSVKKKLEKLDFFNENKQLIKKEKVKFKSLILKLTPVIIIAIAILELVTKR